MKKFLTAIILGLALVSAHAQHNQQYRPGHWPAANYRHDNGGYRGGPGHWPAANYRHDNGGYRGGPGLGWFVPALITGAIVYGATRPSEPATVVVVPATPPQQQPVCPQGTDATYSRSYYQDQSGRYVETYVFTGCMVR
jgi:hypothetical protein